MVGAHHRAGRAMAVPMEALSNVVPPAAAALEALCVGPKFVAKPVNVVGVTSRRVTVCTREADAAAVVAVPVVELEIAGVPENGIL